jgi:hypothetical protein
MHVFFAFEIVLLGAGIVWLLALIPAGVTTAAKGNGRLLGWGCLTFGILWIGGALSLAPADSGWARRFYDSDQLRRARLPFSAQRSRRTYAAWALCAVTSVLVVGLFAARPAPILGVNGSALGASLPHRGGDVLSIDPSLGPCQRSGTGWTCSLYDREGSGGTLEYRVQMHGRGCWTAVPTRFGGWGKLSGCMTIFAYLQ